MGSFAETSDGHEVELADTDYVADDIRRTLTNLVADSRHALRGECRADCLAVVRVFRRIHRDEGGRLNEIRVSRRVRDRSARRAVQSVVLARGPDVISKRHGPVASLAVDLRRHRWILVRRMPTHGCVLTKPRERLVTLLEGPTPERLT
jgi:hypothetical protein